MISIHDITFDYLTESHQHRRVLDHVSLEIPDGQRVAVLGANGSGKSTLARCLNGLLVPAEGEITVDGLDTRRAETLAVLRRHVGMLFQNPDNQIVSATVEREIAFGLENMGMPQPEMHRRVADMLTRFRLQEFRRKSPHYLSGGEKQRLALAAVLAVQPQILVLDEPTSLLDPQSREDMMQLFKEWHDEQNAPARTTVLITQFPEEALAADRAVVLSRGRVVMDDRPHEILSRAQELNQIGLDAPVSIKIQQWWATRRKRSS
jgi:energy-coupling factor transport system ATP-binding protein